MRGSAALFECIVLSCVCVCACVFKCVMKCVYVCSSIQLIPSLYNVWKYILFFRSMYLHFYSSFYSILKLFYKITMHKNQLWLLFCECKTFWGATWGGCYTVWLHLCIMQMTHKCVCVSELMSSDILIVALLREPYTFDTLAMYVSYK